MIKPNLLAVLGIGAAFLLSASATRADDPKPKKKTATEKQEEANYIPPKDRRSGRHKPSVDGRNSTSAKTNTVGGAPSGRETRIPTGTNLPKTYERKGYTSDRDPSTNIYDRNDIRFKDSDTPGDALRQVPGITVGGQR